MPRVKKGILPPEHCASVKEYEASAVWTKTSRTILDDKAFVCEICQRPRWKWLPKAKRWKRVYRGAIHHKNYRNCGKEERGDLMYLCFQCHDLMHLLLRLEKWGGVFSKLADLARTVFVYEGTDTFIPW
jgi:5-methylcytosine-specific restriction endonuclease McrA